MSQIKKGALLSYASVLLTTATGLLLTPFIVGKLGKSEYGLYTLIGSMVAYLGLLDLGINNAVVRFVAKYRSLNDQKGEQQFLGTVIAIYLVMSLVLVTLGIALYYNLSILFSDSLSSEQFKDAKLMLLILVCNLAIALPGAAFSAICDAYERFTFPRTVAIAKYLLRALNVVAILCWGGRAVAIVLIDAVFNVMVIAVTCFYVLVVLKAKFDFSNVQIRAVKHVFSYSVWIFVLAIASKFLWNAGQVILGMETSTEVVAVFAVGIMLGSYYGSFSTALTSVFLPRATQMSIHNSKEEILDMMIKIGRISFMMLMFIFTGFSAVGRDFIQLWMGEGFEQSWVVAMVVMAVFTVPLIQNFANLLLEAENKVSFKARTYLASFSFGLVLGYCLIPRYQELGMIVGIGTGWTLAQVVLNIYFHRNLQLDIPLFFRSVGNGLVIPVLVMGGGLSIVGLYLPCTWSSLVIRIVIYAPIYWVVLYVASMNRFEKQLVGRML